MARKNYLRKPSLRLRKGESVQQKLKQWLIFIASAFIMALVNHFVPSENSGSNQKDAAFSRGARLSCRLLKVTDGDTVRAECDQRNLSIRLIGIDAPEMKQKPWGEQSKAVLSQILPAQFMLESHGADRYQRQLGRILTTDGVDINLEMVKQGRAVAYDGKDTPKNYQQAEAEAKRSKRGVWAKAGDHQDPKKWRRYHQ